MNNSAPRTLGVRVARNVGKADTPNNCRRRPEPPRSVSGRDRFSAHDKGELDAWLKQKCFAHLLKDLAAMKETGRAAIAAVRAETAGCLKEAIELRKRKAHIARTATAQPLTAPCPAAPTCYLP